MLNLADSLTTVTADNKQLNDLKKHLGDQVKNLDAPTIDNFKNGLRNNVMNFFSDYQPAEQAAENDDLALHSINSSPV